MSLPLIIWLPTERDHPWHWFQGEDQGVLGSDTDKSEFGMHGASLVNVVIPGQSVLQLPHDLPPMKEGDRLSAAGFAIENQIAVPLTTQHLTLGPASNNIISIVAHDKMVDILEHLSSAGILPSGLYADFDVIPRGRPLFFADKAVYPNPDGYTVDRDWSEGADQEDQLSQLAGAFNFENAINLLTGVYAPKSSLPISRAALTRMAALFLMAFTAWIGLQWSQARAVNQQTKALKMETAALYTAATGQPAPANPALAVARAVKSGPSQQANFLDLSSLLFRSLEQSDGFMIETLQYDDQKNQLTLRLIYPQFESAGTLETLIASSGGDFQSGGVREQSGRLIGDAVLKAAP